MRFVSGVNAVMQDDVNTSVFLFLSTPFIASYIALSVSVASELPEATLTATFALFFCCWLKILVKFPPSTGDFKNGFAVFPYEPEAFAVAGFRPRAALTL